MREILFRGKSIVGGDWIYGDLIHFSKDISSPKDGTMGIETNALRSTLDRPWIINVDANTVGQYTGIRDINGKKIFEGDILGHKSLRTGKVIANGVVEFSEEGRYAIRDFDLNLDMVIDVGNFVIGNVYDNPELLKEIRE